MKPIAQYMYMTVYITTEVLVTKAEDSTLTKEMKERMKVDLEVCCSDPNVDQLLSIA